MCGYVHERMNGDRIDTFSPKRWVDCGSSTCPKSKNYKPPKKK